MDDYRGNSVDKTCVNSRELSVNETILSQANTFQTFVIQLNRRDAMNRHKERVCISCGCAFSPSGPRSVRCVYCTKEHKRKYQREYQMEWRRKNGDTAVGVGKGGSNQAGSEHPQFKTGMGQFYKLRRILKRELNRCEFCGKDLSDADRFSWCVHHRDRDRTHNTKDNLILLCKSCHQKEHECWKAFEGATTIPQGSRTQAHGVRSAQPLT
jgi:hypothetical protein